MSPTSQHDADAQCSSDITRTQLHVDRSHTYSKPHVLVSLRSKDTFLALRVTLWDQLLAEVFGHIINNSRRFRKNDLFLRSSRRDANDWRSLEWMHSSEIITSTEVLVAFEGFELVLEAQFLEQPYCSLTS
jgi:hypothetical protein